MNYYNKKIDHIDYRIITLLQDNASLSIKEISTKVGLSLSPCWKRIQRLEKDGFIKKKTAILDPVKLGYSNRVFVFIKTNQHNKKWSEKFRTYILNQDNVIGLYRISGSFDYIIDVLSKSMSHYDSFYKNLIENVDLFEVSSSFVMEIMKETTKVPLK